MNLMKLEIIELLDKHKKITTVAEILELKQPTVSFHMKSLEQELGVRLFETRSGGTTLSEAGRALCHYATKINALAREAKRIVREFDELGRGTLNIGASYVPGTYILPKIIGSFTKEYPRISVSLMIRTAPVIQEMLLAHEIDVGFISTEPLHSIELDSETLCEDELVVIFAPGHKFSRCAQLVPDLLNGEPFILHSKESATRQMTEKWGKVNQIRIHQHMEADSLESIKQLVMLGEGISFASRLAVHREVERGEIRCLPIPNQVQTRSIVCIHHRDRWQSSMMTAFHNHLKRIY